MTWYPDEKVCTLSWEWWHGHDTVMTESECNWTQGHQSGQHQAPCCHTQSQSLLSQSLHHRSPHKANQPGRVIRMHYQTMECLRDALDHCLVQFFLHCLKIPWSTSLHSWHLNPAHKCLHCYCGKKVRRSWHGHDTNMTESECNWIQRHQSGQHQAPCCHTQSQSLLSQSLHHRSPHKANQPGRVIRMHYQTMECLHDALDHCLVQIFQSPSSKNSTINIPAFLAPKSCSQVLALLVNSKLEKRSEGHDMVMTPTWLNPSATEYSDIKVDNIKHHAATHSHSRCCHNLCTTGPRTKQINQDG